MTYVRKGDYSPAEGYLREALRLSEGRLLHHAAKSRVYISSLKYLSGDIDSALLYIRDTPGMVVPAARNFALAYGTHIYHKAGILDTAYMYSIDLASNDDPQQKEVAYEILLAPELRSYLEDGDLDRYVSDYRTLLVDYFDENQNQLVLNQQNLYNYRFHEREKAAAKREVSLFKSRIIIGIMTFLLIIISLVLVSLYFKNKSKSNIIELQHALSQIVRLKQELGMYDLGGDWPGDASLESKAGEGRQKLQGVSPKTEDELRDHLKSELMALYKKCDERAPVSKAILDSDVYKRLQEYIQIEHAISGSDTLWSEMENVVLASSPKFRANLNLLAAGNLTTIDLHTALLIKCGIRHSKMCILLGRSNGAIISRRETLSMKILGEKKGMKVIDGIIRLL